MAKRELSSTLRNLKFMQRAAQREDKSKKEEEVTANGNFPSSGAFKKCTVIVEGDSHPGAVKGRMSFQSFNPSIEKLNEEATNLSQPEASASCSGNRNGRVSDRESCIPDGSENSKLVINSDADGEHKRKQAEVVSETQHPNKSHKSVEVDQELSANDSRSSRKQQKKLDWNVLRPPKAQKKRQ